MVSSHVMTDLLLHRRRARALFLPRTTQHVRSFSLTRELVRAVGCLVALVAWGGVLLLLGG